jgi:hypothetical protein
MIKVDETINPARTGSVPIVSVMWRPMSEMSESLRSPSVIGVRIAPCRSVSFDWSFNSEPTGIFQKSATDCIGASRPMTRDPAESHIRPGFVGLAVFMKHATYHVIIVWPLPQ